MKITKQFLILTLVTTRVLYADEKITQKITQMIYAKDQNNPYISGEKTFDRNVIYYLSDNQLYMKDTTNPLTRTDYKIDIYQFRDKKKQKQCEKDQDNLYFDSLKPYEEDFEKINNANIMRIGKPAIVKNPTKKYWAMPLVRKTRWFSGNFLWGSGNLFKTDLCVLEQKNVLQGSRKSASELNQRKTIYLLKKVGEGHRTKTNFIGLQNVSKTMLIPPGCQKPYEGWTILSSSTWPTVKWTSLNSTVPAVEWKDQSYYVIDGEPKKEDFIAFGKLINIEKRLYGIERLFFTNRSGESGDRKKSAVTSTYSIKNPEKTKRLQAINPNKDPKKFTLTGSDIPLYGRNIVNWVLYLPAIKISPDFNANWDKVYAQIESAFKKIAEIEEKRKNVVFNAQFEQLQVYLTPKNEPIIIAEDIPYRAIHYLNEKINFKKNSEEEKKYFFITASTFDFENNRLILGLYNKENNKQSIKEIELNDQMLASDES
ncbi:MAG TPA: hypothetical protein VL201_02480 [Patescibacteria group bacterium]|nr:hypothetical protein [Patescibacteria group bacterium]